MQSMRRRETLTDQLTRTLTERIAAGRYMVGAKLPSEQEMIGEFGVSRTVVREAIAKLRARGTVATMQGVGAFVVQQEITKGFEIDSGSLSAVQEMVSVLELRIALESEAAVLAAQRRTPAQLAAMKAVLQEMNEAIARGEDAVQADMRFHQQIAEAAGNPHFLKLFNYVGELLIPRARLQAVRLDNTPMPDYLARVQREHEQICYAIERQDPEAARAALRMHLSESKARLQRSLAQMGA
ncbi:MAG: GntR family transcriptional regulator [Candidatus Dactylopiibacterium carminicum]|uniref:FadR family transcriptional regulator n=1 Tax=Candidatus Dactylopiibacterium carminicum TaxID=857335 RepID=A0A272EVW1_9RHOO|nr:FadR/GntR family transcriptional regulator [Candidatus Dactylopiibacterium carminicum]KAF7599600.1 FadR family transcriptional regulator [Candidatus Dactylopiibacterium carminicum]PAS94247.1 MAG: GntR family transcriptional regulator [Candidatus Dactylopiibacterium carminicum]PAS98444.1 MAG: GntR family transcriptional regulator [Candidatus Dactylopiibacterium carminicum]PAS99602.1 MAG: GntR family transcriptional regulator [Candidatus Dactylopiibacterium carminicum]